MEEQNPITQELLETIERYLNQSMSDSEYQSFTSQLQNSPGLQQQVKDVELLLSGIESAALQEKMNHFHEAVPSEEKEEQPISLLPNKRRKFISYGVAASLILALGLFWIFGQQSNSEKLFAKHFRPDPGLPTTMDTSNNFDFYDAMVNYKQGDYGVAIEKWEELASKVSISDTLQYFIGVAHLAEGNENKAINLLKSVSENNESVFTKEAQYYLGLSYLKADQVNDAKKMFTFSNTESAREVLSELNN